MGRFTRFLIAATVLCALAIPLYASANPPEYTRGIGIDELFQVQQVSDSTYILIGEYYVAARNSSETLDLSTKVTITVNGIVVSTFTDTVAALKNLGCTACIKDNCASIAATNAKNAACQHAYKFGAPWCMCLAKLNLGPRDWSPPPINDPGPPYKFIEDHDIIGMRVEPAAGAEPETYIADDYREWKYVGGQLQAINFVPGLSKPGVAALLLLLGGAGAVVASRRRRLA